MSSHVFISESVQRILMKFGLWCYSESCRVTTNSLEQGLASKMIVFQLVKKFPTFHEIRRFITAYKKARH
jgi:ABC-type proline/glycine betaine transport system substrate-binding protein